MSLRVAALQPSPSVPSLEYISALTDTTDWRLSERAHIDSSNSVPNPLTLLLVFMFFSFRDACLQLL